MSERRFTVIEIEAARWRKRLWDSVWGDAKPAGRWESPNREKAKKKRRRRDA